MAKSQLNQLSKRQILESLMQEQTQSNATLSRLITAVARTARLDPKKLSEMFVDDKGNQEFIDQFNQAVREHHIKQHEQAQKETQKVTGAENSASPEDSTKENK